MSVIRVECYAGYRGEETPQRIHLGERTVEIVDVLERWRTPEHRYFKCEAADGVTYILRHEAFGDRWELSVYKRSVLE